MAELIALAELLTTFTIGLILIVGVALLWAWALFSMSK